MSSTSSAASRPNHAAFFAALVALAALAGASVTTTLDRLDLGEPGPWPPSTMAVVDVLVDVSEKDVWTAAGLRVTTFGGVTIRYTYDPNTNEPDILNPGTADRFVTCISRPRGRHGDARFTNALAAYAGGYCPAAPNYTASPTEFNVAWYSSPPATSGSPSVDGAIARIAFDISSFSWCGCCPIGVFPASQIPPYYGIWLALFECEGTSAGVVSASFDVPTPLGDDWVLVLNRGGGHLCEWSVDFDYDVDLQDLALMLDSFGHCSGEPGFDSRADFDDDGCIGLTDLTTLLAHFGLPCC